MEMLKVNEIYESYIGMPEGISTTLTDGGIQMLITFDKPLDEEINFIRQGKAEFKLIVKNDIPFILSKFGGLEWMETPIKVDEDQVSSISNIDCSTMGYGLYIILADVRTGIVKVLRAIGLGNKFSKDFNAMILRSPILANDEYIKRVFAVQRNYSTKDLVKMSYVSYRTGEENV